MKSRKIFISLGIGILITALTYCIEIIFADCSQVAYYVTDYAADSCYSYIFTNQILSLIIEVILVAWLFNIFYTALLNKNSQKTRAIIFCLLFGILVTGISGFIKYGNGYICDYSSSNISNNSNTANLLENMRGTGDEICVSGIPFPYYVISQGSEVTPTGLSAFKILNFIYDILILTFFAYIIYKTYHFLKSRYKPLSSRQI